MKGRMGAPAMSGRRAIALVAALAVPGIAAASSARAETITVGLFAPSAPFEGTPARVEFATRLAERLGDALGVRGVGRVYGHARDFAAAVRRGDVQLAVVDPTYLADVDDGHTVVAVGVRAGRTDAPWQLVSRTGARRVLELRGRSVLVPGAAGREDAFARQAMFGGELPPGFFSRIDAAPDVLSAVTAVGLGKADAAIIPTGIALPAGVTATAVLPSVSWPVLVAYGLSKRQRIRAASAAASFPGGTAIAGFRIEDGDGVRRLGRRLAARAKRGPMAIPDVGIVAAPLVDRRRLTIGQADVLRFAVTPPAPDTDSVKEGTDR
jgi:hypothetical protein